ncbi:MAG: MerR family transcriptional regulator, partial [Hyphomicrobiaceae bacterium]
MAKAAEAFRTISEVAEELDLHKHVLRFWEVKFPQIKPMKRGGGRRYYRPADLELLRGIRRLLHDEGYTIKGVQRILRERGVESVKGVGAVAPGAVDGAGTGEPSEAGQFGPVGVSRKAAAKKQRSQGKRKVASDQSAGGAAEIMSSGKAVGNSVPREHRLAAAIAELQACRAILTGASAATAMETSASKVKRS